MNLERKPAARERASVEPVFRILVGLLGLGLLAYGWRRKDRVGGLLMGAGLGGIVQAAWGERTITLFTQLLSPVVKLNRSVYVAVPVEVAYDWWSDFSHFPEFMSYVSDVRVNDRGNVSWTLSGPGGIPLRWESVIGKLQSNQFIEWSSLPGSGITVSGKVRFHRVSDESSRIDVELSYALPAGALGKSLVRVLGFDPAGRIDEDLERMKKLIESKEREHLWQSRIS